MAVLKNNNATVICSENKYQIISNGKPLPFGWLPANIQPKPNMGGFMAQRRRVSRTNGNPTF
jgi:hypothetical protein